MRIGIDCRMYSSNFTGIGRYTFELVRHIIKINEHSKKPHKIVLFFNEPEFSNFKSSSPHIEKVLVKAKHYSFAEQTKFLKKLYSARLDHVHFPHFNVPLLYRKSYTITIHDLTLSLFPGKKMTKWYHRLAYNLTLKNAVKKAKHIITISKNTKKDLLQLTKTPNSKVSISYIGVSEIFHKLSKSDQPKVASTLEKYNIKNPFLLYTGVWRSHKNLPRLIKAFRLVRDELKNSSGDNSQIQLVITGKEDPFYPEVRQEIKDQKLEKSVKLTGLVSEQELVHLYNAAEIYVFPTLYEGFGLPPLEAMKCGTPVAASNAACIPEVCGKENASYFDPTKTEELSKTILKLHKKPELRQDLISNGLTHASNFTWQKSAKHTYEIIKENLPKNH